ncbi:MAG: ABC transporter ATP-binding protein [Candidatus Poribacteria bacterium]|nr:ABC transporter ATP-binding protein [Candidatus Poribacteria bacterium]MDP6745825.1 ABC transporter ATP-binding protein [Candidatus Poribacteria bacterium]MDP6994988.1 ABC transporter ATP-binding protein [Candidatus Poribacteria bacterium]
MPTKIPMLLELSNATKIYQQRNGRTKQAVVALQDFNLKIAHQPAKIIAIAGESGSGKTTLANLILGFVQPTSGQVIYQGVQVSKISKKDQGVAEETEDISIANSKQMRDYRRNVQAIFQDPFGVYNPFYRIQHVFDLVIKNFGLSDNSDQARQLVESTLNAVGLRGHDVLRKYPHQLSGGQRQRIMMARAYLVRPKLIVADEPVSMIDASLRASILDVMLRLKEEAGISFLYITHDLSTAYQIGDQIYILYQGSVAEKGKVTKVIERPHHPYVKLLVDSVPLPDPAIRWKGEIDLPAEEEMRGSATSGCRFYPRCPVRIDRCLENQPDLYDVSDDHQAACYQI